MKLSRVIVAALFMMFAAATTTSLAQSINELISKGTIRVGVNSAAPPFSIVNAAGQIEGYDVDVANALAEYMGVKAEITAHTTAARIPALETNLVDMVIGTLTPTPARANVVMFTIPYVTFTTNVIAPAGTDISGWEDLAGKTVAVARATPQEVALVAAAPEGTNISRFDDDSIAIQAMASGQVDAVVVPNTILAEFQKARPNTDLELKFEIARQYMSIAVRHDAHDLHQWLNTVIAWMKVSGQLDEISIKWTGQPFPKDAPVF